MDVFLDPRLRRPGARRAAAVDHRLRPALPAAGLLLRDVRAGRADPQRPRPVRPDDVGADRQQRHLGRRARHLPGRVRPGRRATRSSAPSPPARSCCSASARRSASSPSSWCWCPTCAPPASATARASTSGAPAWATRCGSAVWTVLFVIVNQIAYSVVVRLASGGTAVLRRRHRLHGLLLDVPDHDGAALDRDGLAGDRDPAAALARAAEGDRTGLARTLSRDAAHRAGRGAAVRAAAAGDRARPVARDLGLHGAAADTFDHYVPSLALFGIGLVFFTVHYLMLRGFYALELTRTVFLIQCAVAATNIVAALLLVRAATAAEHRAGAGARLQRRPTWSARSISYAVLRAAARRAAHPDPGALPGAARDRGRRRDRGGRRGGVPPRPGRRRPGLGARGRPACSSSARSTWSCWSRSARAAPPPGGHHRGRDAHPPRARPAPALTPPYDGPCPGIDEGSCVPSSIRPGDVLADRYRLVDLLTESGGGRFWRAHDRVLERHVALHVMAAGRRARRRAARGRPALRDSSTTGGCCGCWTPTAPTAWSTSSTSGARATPSTSCSPARAR